MGSSQCVLFPARATKNGVSLQSATIEPTVSAIGEFQFSFRLGQERYECKVFVSIPAVVEVELNCFYKHNVLKGKNVLRNVRQ